MTENILSTENSERTELEQPTSAERGENLDEQTSIAEPVATDAAEQRTESVTEPEATADEESTEEHINEEEPANEEKPASEGETAKEEEPINEEETASGAEPIHEAEPANEEEPTSEEEPVEEEETTEITAEELTDNGSLERYIENNDDDSEEKADERGVSGLFDAYGREIIADVFENRLRMSENAIKIAYSRIKNLLKSHGLNRRFDGIEEFFFIDDKILVTMKIDGKTLFIRIKDKEYEIVRDDGGSYLKAMEAVKRFIKKSGFKESEDYVFTAYATRYAFNPDAVIRGDEDKEPEETDFSDEQYDPIENEAEADPVAIIKGLVEEIAEQEELVEGLTQKVNDAKGAAAVSEPIVYFYNAALDEDSKVVYINVQQVLNDKFLGKMLPQLFFAIAERSDRIITLNLLAVEHVAKVADGDPDRLYVTQASPVLLTKEESKKKLYDLAKTANGNLCLSFDAALLESLGEQGKTSIRELAEEGVKIMIDGTENAGLKVLTEYNADYLRFDARYYTEEDEKKSAHLTIVAEYANTQGIPSCVKNASTVKETRYLLSRGIKVVEGDIVGVPVRLVNNAIRSAKKLPK